jgi:polynucleotide 5'-hydroxyl-kinase GRC3/NOL9
MHLPAEWQQAADRITARARPGLRVMVVGATDTGKSTFCRYLASRLVQAGLEVGLVDADVGQSTIGPPAAISGGLVAGPIDTPAQVKPAASVFVGSISPVGHLLPCVVGTKRVSQRLEQLGAAAIVVDTSGLILGGAGQALKEHKFDLLQPHIVVALQQDQELQHLVHLWQRSTADVSVLRPSPAVATRTPTERRRYRGQRFAELFRNARVATLRLPRLAWRGTRLGRGQALAPRQLGVLSEMLNTQVLHGQRQGDEAVLVTAGYPPWPAAEVANSMPGVERVTLLPLQRFTGVLCGLLNPDGFLATMAILQRLDFSGQALEFMVPEGPPRDIGVVHVGRLRMDSQGRELVTLRPGEL